MDIMIVQLLGHVENMESMKMAMQREAKEEICIDIDLKDLEFVTFIHKINGNDIIYYNGYFKANKWQGEPQIGEPDKNAEIKWFPIHALPENIIDDRKQAIQNYIDKIPYSEFGWNEIGSHKDSKKFF